jgi:hypothetical protein
MRKLLLTSLYAFSSFSHNPTALVGGGPKRFHSSNEPDTDFVMPKGIIDLFKWRFIKNNQTVPYTNRTRFIQTPLSLERKMGETLFQYHKQFFDILPSTHPDTVRVTNIFNRIIHALYPEKNKMCSASSQYTVWLHLTRRLSPFMSHLDGLNWDYYS